ncbi:hypothetical protein [Mycetocola spongiae]|uniref:hypothetical protein n=1 Tax=Mycetocola spongiae TaxID=2859226 RepID=UPI001CF2D250|nr:hypothetical protein [Mycetocola spongiae]UCR88420.1 hypothetical protein KXZ72_10655 [Mycetocola spongiae]
MNTPHAAHRIGAHALLLATAFWATGCGYDTPNATTPSRSESQMIEDALQQREQFWTELDQVQDIIGGEWERHDNPLADFCEDAEHKKYLYSGARLRSEPLPDPVATGKRLRTYWEEQGYTVTEQSFTKNHRNAVAENGNGRQIILETKTLAGVTQTALFAETGCFTGDVGVIAHYLAQAVRASQAADPPSPSPEP